MTCTRRDLLLGSLAGFATACTHARNATPDALTAIEASVGGRVGVYALDTGTGRELTHRADERFAMCSTFKWFLSAAVFARVDRGELAIDERVAYSAADLLEHAPSTRARVGEGAMSIADLARAAVTVSDNTAANLLLAKAGGPAGVTTFVRAQGDTVTRLDRTEPALNTNEADDPRDTTSPRAMVGLMRAVLCGGALAPSSRERLLGLLRDCETGKDRLRAGLPAGWSVGDKTGTGARSAVNDVAIVYPPGRAPILVAAYLSDGPDDLPALVAAHAEIGRQVVRI